MTNMENLRKTVALALAALLLASSVVVPAAAVDTLDSTSVGNTAAGEGTTETHTIEFAVNNVSGDGVEDLVRVHLNTYLTNEISNISVSVTNSSGSSVPVSTQPTLVDSDGDGIANEVEFGVNPSQTQDLTVSVTVDLDHYYVSRDISNPVDATVLDSDGTSVSGTVGSITINNLNSSPSLAAENYTAEVGESLSQSKLNVSISDSDGTVSTVEYRADTDGDGTPESYADLANVSFGSTGTYDLTILVTDDYGESSVSTVTVDVVSSTTTTTTTTTTSDGGSGGGTGATSTGLGGTVTLLILLGVGLAGYSIYRDDEM